MITFLLSKCMTSGYYHGRQITSWREELIANAEFGLSQQITFQICDNWLLVSVILPLCLRKKPNHNIRSIWSSNALLVHSCLSSRSTMASACFPLLSELWILPFEVDLVKYMGLDSSNLSSGFENNKGLDQIAHSLISTFVICLESITFRFATSKISIF